MSSPYFTDDAPAERSFFQRFGLVIGIAGSVLVGGGIMLVRNSSKSSSASHRMPEVTMVKIVSTPPPPPPPPPAPPKLVEEKMVEQTPVDANEQKPDESPSSPTPDLGTSITGSGGADAFGLGSNRASDGAGVGGKRGSGSRFGWYAAQVQATVSDSLRNHPKTRLASFQIEVRLWPDLTGRITRAKLVGSTGNASMDEAIKTEVLAGLQLREPPPADLPLPIVLRLNARRPN